MLAVAALALASSVIGPTDPPADASCIERLLAAAATTHEFPTLSVVPDRAAAGRWAEASGIPRDVDCLADDGTARITYAVVEGDVIVDPEQRPTPSGAAWADVDGTVEVVQDLAEGGATRIDLALPDVERSPIRLLAVGVGHDRATSVVWRFGGGAAANHVADLEAALAEIGFGATDVDVRGDVVLATVRLASGDVTPRPIDLALLASRDGTEFPDVVGAEVACGDGRYDFSVTISSPYDTPEQYADGWRVVGTDAVVYGEHQLMHDHAAEQPFTRTQRGVSIPADVDAVVIEGRDLANGYGGDARSVALPDCQGG